MNTDNKRWKYYFFLIKNSKFLLIGSILLIFILFLAFFGPYITPKDPFEIELSNRFLPPSSDYPFGTDWLGRDMLSRIIHGARYTLSAAIISSLIGLGIGVPLGGFVAFSGKKVDMIAMRVVDIMLAFPSFILAIAMNVALGPSLLHSAMAVGISYIPGTIRMIRSKVLSVKEMEYIEAARTIGASPIRILFIHILPNAIPPVLIGAMVGLGWGILMISGLSFIGLGAQPPTPEWGLMILKGREYILTGEWWMAIIPGIFIAISVTAFNLIGDGMRDILSPKLRIT